MPSLTDKLKSLGVKVASDLPAPRREEQYDIASVMSGDQARRLPAAIADFDDVSRRRKRTVSK